MSKTIKNKWYTKHCPECGKDLCKWCKSSRTIRTKREELRTNIKSEEEHIIHSSDDSLEAFYPEILGNLHKIYE